MFSKVNKPMTDTPVGNEPVLLGDSLRTSHTSTSASTSTSAPITKASAPSMIGPDLKITGDLASAGDIQIDGTIEGDIDSRTLTVGEQANVMGSIAADLVRVCGTVSGEIRAKSVILTETARVTGDIVHETLSVEAGAHLEGQIRRLDSGKTTGKSAPVADAKPLPAKTNGASAASTQDSKPAVRASA